MLKAIYFALHFAMIMLGLVIAIHFDPWLGLALFGVFAIKFGLMLPDLNERHYISVLSFKSGNININLIANTPKSANPNHASK